MKCPKCGADNPINRLFCDACGAEIEHKIEDVQASVDQEVRVERMKSAARTIRWFFVVAFILAVVGYVFRRSYKDLPDNEIVAFAAAPTVKMDDRVSVETQDFGVDLPRPQYGARPEVPFDEKALDRELAKEAADRITVLVKQKSSAAVVKGILVGDLVFYVPVAGQAEPRPVHIAEVTRLAPAGAGQWEIAARGLPAPTRIAIPDAAKVKLPLHRTAEPTKNGPLLIPLDSLENLSPAF